MRLLVASVLFLAACCAPSLGNPHDLETATKSVVQVDAGPGSYGSGFVIRSTKIADNAYAILILTAKHVTDGAPEGWPKVLGVEATVVANHLEFDTSLVSVVLDQPMPVATMRLNQEVEVGENLYGMGFSGGQGELWVTHGVASNRDRGASAVPGDSGGPIVDANGHVVGIIVSIDVGSNGFSRDYIYHHCAFVPVVDLVEWLEMVVF